MPRGIQADDPYQTDLIMKPPLVAEPCLEAIAAYHGPRL